jgi:acetyltransferase-like isoleucine patch superfamily enzyme
MTASSSTRRTVPGDWYDGEVPDNVVLEEGSYLETSFSLLMFRSRLPVGVRLGPGASAYRGTMFDVGPGGSVEVGRFGMLNAVRIICDGRLEIGDHALISWGVVLMDCYREPFEPAARGHYRRAVAEAPGRAAELAAAPRPIRIGPNVWIGFDSCVLPGVTIGEGSIVGARSVVVESVPPYSVVAGNPARLIRQLDRSPHDTPRNAPT